MAHDKKKYVIVPTANLGIVKQHKHSLTRLRVTKYSSFIGVTVLHEIYVGFYFVEW